MANAIARGGQGTGRQSSPQCQQEQTENCAINPPLRLSLSAVLAMLIGGCQAAARRLRGGTLRDRRRILVWSARGLRAGRRGEYRNIAVSRFS